MRKVCPRKSARGQECQVRIPGVCSGHPETSVLAPYRLAGTCGAGCKPADENDLVKVSIRWPDNCDFNDMLMNGDQVREQVFYKKVAA
ncbi:TPA: DUF1364 family protein [Klebsiella pneumoniae]|nr:DUF1364 family protein [Klebsiella pneumoniae]HCB0080052.1 DUF1364 family protein [Klebsiella pneumoniae]HEB5774735.1 DUF1364 family protein [Klebsiella pneumoniae]HEB9057919.1 DUF1364 family protein [Klebsiella pneumoniae]HEB9061846.1 DUF1364 family protein [Klebsiella pneumoniae]